MVIKNIISPIIIACNTGQLCNKGWASWLHVQQRGYVGYTGQLCNKGDGLHWPTVQQRGWAGWLQLCNKARGGAAWLAANPWWGVLFVIEEMDIRSAAKNGDVAAIRGAITRGETQKVNSVDEVSVTIVWADISW